MAQRQVPRVLLVEDDHVNAHVARTILERLGYHVDVATTGTEAVEFFRGDPHDLVLMDSDLPLMDGFEATKAIRKLPGGASVPILGTTASGERLKCLMAGMNEVVPKPFERRKLKAEIERWLDPGSDKT